MFGGLLASLALGVGMLVIASCNASAIAAGQVDGGPSVTGSMYNGNNAKPPDLAAHEARVEPAGNQTDPKFETPAGANNGGNSTVARAGGGG